MLRWLVDRFPGRVEIDWEDSENEERLASVLPRLIPLLDEEALVDVGVPYRAWLTAAKAAASGSDLEWLLQRLGAAPTSADARGILRDGFQLRVRWELGESRASRTRAKLPVSRVFFHRGALARWRGSFSRRLPGPPISLKRASAEEAAALLDAARAAVTVRYREVHAFNFADPRDVSVADLGRGIQIAWFGLAPGHRLPIRAHFGYLLLKNGVPVGYGDASLLFEWADVAFNIFETFRRGESAFVFVRVLAFLLQAFGVRAFHLSRYQIGYGNAEAIESGAFWFYYKLGFRPTPAELRRLAREEWRRIARDSEYRSSRETLERFCQAGMFASVGGRVDRAVRDFEVSRLGPRAAAGRARVGADRLLTGVAGWLGAGRWRMWPSPERMAFERLGLVLGLIPELPRWPLRERRALVELIRAKGGRAEAEYLRRLQALPRLRDSLLKLGSPS